MLLSSGVIWRHRTLEGFRAECPGGDPGLQELIVDQLDERLDWLESLGARVVRRETGNPRTIGRRFTPRDLVTALMRHAGDVLLGEPVSETPDEPLVLATGGFGADLARRLSLPLRASPWSEGDALALARGLPPRRRREWTSSTAARCPRRLRKWRHTTSCGCRRSTAATPPCWTRRERPLESENGAWHENDLVQEIARRPQGHAWFLVGEDVLGRPVGDATVRDRIDAAREAGGTVVRPDELPFTAPPDARYAVHVTASVTHTIGGLVVDPEARVLRDDGTPVEGLYAAGVDVGGIATGGYSSGLAAALVLGCVAAESIGAL